MINLWLSSFVGYYIIMSEQADSSAHLFAGEIGYTIAHFLHHFLGWFAAPLYLISLTIIIYRLKIIELCVQYIRKV